MAGLGRVPAAVGAAEDCSVGAGGVSAPDVYPQGLAESANETALSATGFADQEQRPEPNRGASNEVGESGVDRLCCVREFEQQRAADLFERRYLYERQRDIDDALEGTNDVAELTALHLIP